MTDTVQISVEDYKRLMLQMARYANIEEAAKSVLRSDNLEDLDKAMIWLKAALRCPVITPMIESGPVTPERLDALRQDGYKLPPI